MALSQNKLFISAFKPGADLGELIGDNYGEDCDEYCVEKFIIDGRIRKIGLNVDIDETFNCFIPGKSGY